MRTLVRSPFARRALVLAFSLALVAGCASSGSGSSSATGPRAIAVSLNGYGDAPFRLVSASHTPPVDLYSAEVTNASTKVLNDEAMVALVEHLEGLGFRGYSRAGRAPAGAQGNLAKSIEVDEDGRSAWWPLHEGASAAELKAFQTAMRDFLGLYNIAQSWQSVDNTLGGDYFEKKKSGR